MPKSKGANVFENRAYSEIIRR